MKKVVPSITAEEQSRARLGLSALTDAAVPCVSLQVWPLLLFLLTPIVPYVLYIQIRSTPTYIKSTKSRTRRRAPSLSAGGAGRAGGAAACPDPQRSRAFRSGVKLRRGIARAPAASRDGGFAPRTCQSAAKSSSVRKSSGINFIASERFFSFRSPTCPLPKFQVWEPRGETNCQGRWSCRRGHGINLWSGQSFLPTARGSSPSSVGRVLHLPSQTVQ